MQFEKSIEVDVDAERLWEVVAHDFDRVGEWSSAVNASAANPEAIAPEGATVGGRVCDTTFGDIQETFVDYDESAKRFVFRATGLPSYITLAQNTVEVVPVAAGRSSVSLSIRMETNVVGKVMGPMFAIKLKNTLDTFLVELKDFVERGELSNRKHKQLAKAGR
ncbi:MAG: SRPBCC family protein [Actinomycetota bacterium]